MSVVFSSAQVLARRAVPWCSAPRGTPSRLVKLRLDRSFHRNGVLQAARAVSSQAAAAASIDNDIPPSLSTTSSNAVNLQCIFDADELELLNQVLKTPIRALSRAQATSPRANSFTGKIVTPVRKEERADNDTWKGDNAAVVATGETHTLPSLTEALKDPIGASEFLTKMLGDAMKKVDLESPESLAKVPPTAFSELLRCLDPLEVIAEEVDPSAGIRVGPGMADRTPLGDLIDVFGVRKVYVLLFRRILAAVELRLEAGQPLLASDYVILFRFAGAASDPDSAASVWKMLKAHSPYLTSDARLYAEFVKARFLVDPLYGQYDSSRLRVRPVNLVNTKHGPWNQLEARWKLRNLQRRIMYVQSHRFGQNRYKPEIAEDVTRVLRKKKQIMRHFEDLWSGKYTPSESIVCAVLVGLGRTGSLKHVEDVLLRYFGVVVRHEPGQVTVTGRPMGLGPKANSPMQPTEQLLDAIVEAFCTQSELQAAVKVVDYISRRFSIQVPHRVWGRLLEWSYILCQKGIKAEWAMAGLAHKTPEPQAVQAIWDMMTAPPFDYQPSMYEHGLLIKSLIILGKCDEAIQRMLELRPRYQAIVAEAEAAFYKYLPLQRLAVGRHRARREWQVAKAKKEEAWYHFQLWLHFLFKRGIPKKVDDDMAVRMIPQLVHAFRPLLPEEVKYRVQTGVVQLRRMHRVQRFRPQEGTLHQPAWVTGDLVGRVPAVQTADVKSGAEVQQRHFAAPKLSHADRLKRVKTVTKRKPISTDIDAERFVESMLPIETLVRQFT